VNAFGVRLFPGGYGEAVRVCDLEYSWNLSHQDLPAITRLGINPSDPYNDTNHGTAVLGELFGRENGWGVTGGVPSAVPYVAHTNFTTGYNVAQAITNSLGTLGQGDVIIIEQQFQGPNYTGVPTGTQFGLVPVEWNLGVYNTILTAIGNRVHVVMAAGNGSQDLDTAAYTTGNGGHHPFQAGSDSGSTSWAPAPRRAAARPSGRGWASATGARGSTCRGGARMCTRSGMEVSTAPRA
jgi:subtilisin family serine protease